jgi:DNA-binding NtrC family response regulator
MWTPEALRTLAAHDWPGNVRELENVVLRACLCADSAEIGRGELLEAEPALADRELRADAADARTLSAAKGRAIALFERTYLLELMRRASGNVSEAARLAGTERRHLGKLLKKHRIENRVFRRA